MAPPKTHFLYFLLADQRDALGDGPVSEIDWERYDAATSRITRLLTEDEEGAFSPHAEEIETWRIARRKTLDALKGKRKGGKGGAVDPEDTVAELRRAIDHLIAAL